MNYRQRPNSLGQAKELWQAVRHHKWSILLATVVLVAIAIVQISLLTDYYQASTMVLVDPQKLPEKYVSPTVGADPAQRLTTLTEEVLNPTRLQQVARDLQLYGSNTVPQNEIVDQLRRSTTIEMKASSDHEMSAFVITYIGKKPDVVALVANRLADSFIKWDLALREHQTTNTTEFLTAQLQDAKQALNSAEMKLGEFKQEHSGELPEDVPANMQALYRLQLANQTNTDSLDHMEQEETLLTESPEATRTGATVPSDRSRLENERRTLQSELSDLRTQYTEQYPDVITVKERLRRVTDSLSRIAPEAVEASAAGVRLRIVKQETERLQREGKSLTEEIDQYQAKINAAPIRAHELEDLNRDYNNAKEQYQVLLDNRFHAGMAMDLERKQESGRFTVEPASIPEKPIKPNRILLLGMALPFCLVAPAGIAIAIAEVRGTVNSARMLRPLLPVAAHIIGDIPTIETPQYLRRRRSAAIVSIAGSLACFVALAVFLWKVHPHL